MAYRQKRKGGLLEGIIIFVVIAGLAALLIPLSFKELDITSLALTLAPLIFIAGEVLLVWIKFKENQRLRLLSISDVDKMTGVEFEQYVGKILQSKGYGVTFTKASGDLGVDILASKGNETTGIQLKRYKENVSRTAISDVVGAKDHYGYTRCMVITTSYFTKDAKTLAESSKCKLVDRQELEQWIVEFQANKNRIDFGFFRW